MQHLLLLHGALGDRDQLVPLGDQLADEYYVHRLNFTGHGGEPLLADAWSIASFAQDVVTYMDIYVPAGEPVHLFGYSMGGYVGMYICRHYPGRISRAITLATKFNWDEEVATREVRMLHAETIRQKVPAFAEELEKRHGSHKWKDVLERTAGMLLEMGKGNPLQAADYPAISAPCLLLLGDRDKMVSLDETTQVYKQLPVAQLGVLPATPHALEQVDMVALGAMIKKFIGS
ncbi:alpha/beta fold hydrolase [Paraflavitalea pollutisoli]|uniref:alpha/beta fold hydrolase n=1 Tax=Paraflavitalea pollutisoli TaxID=3034143 RepID=UPI0023ECBAEA|nr:alpha/beta fold hydrolase [Paraflavitalea sp. H1-2-19X]